MAKQDTTEFVSICVHLLCRLLAGCVRLLLSPPIEAFEQGHRQV